MALQKRSSGAPHLGRRCLPPLQLRFLHGSRQWQPPTILQALFTGAHHHLPCSSHLQPDPSQLFNRPPRARKQQRSKQQQQQQQRKPGDSAGSGGGGGGRPSVAGGGPGASSGGSSGLDGAARVRPGPGSGGRWGQVLGGLVPLAAGGHLQCPTPIVRMRAAIAALKPVRQLRPQALPVRWAPAGGPDAAVRESLHQACVDAATADPCARLH